MSRLPSPPILAGGAVFLALTVVGLTSGYPCITTGMQYGVWADRCPASNMRLAANVNAHDLVRDRWRSVSVSARALWIEDSVYGRLDHEYTLNRGLDLAFQLLDSKDQPIDGLETRDLDWGRYEGSLEVKVPDVPDGDYRLRATIDAGFESVDVDVALPFYRPALVHLMSDRPLYKPGQEVLLRGAVLRKRDSKPIGERPGTWRITDPSGIEMMVEKVPTDAHGVSATTFPLDSEAEVGTWRATYTTGSDSDTITFRVEPFQLPRFTVELEPSAKWYGSDDVVKISGTARYTSGAPVRNAQVRLQLSAVEGRWPMPLAWEEPIEVKTTADGRFSHTLGEVPADLIEKSRIAVRAQVTDEARETVSGSTMLVLSQDSLALSAVSELRSGLVEKFNNRAYVRVTTPDGRPLRKTALRLSNPYDPSAPTMEATTDEDGVAALQIDPGAPVTIVHPPPPVRTRPLQQGEPRLSVAQRMPGNNSLGLAERRAFDRVHPAIKRCGTLTVGGEAVEVGLNVSANGSVRRATAPDTAIGRCVANATRGVRLPSGQQRSYKLVWQVPDSLQPHLTGSDNRVFGSTSAAEAALNRATTQARRCFTINQGIDSQIFEAHWSQVEGSTRLEVDLLSLGSAGLSPAVRTCAANAIRGATLNEPADSDAMGVRVFRLSVPTPPGQIKPRATTSTGFQFKVEALAANTEPEASGKLSFGVGSIPNVRLRATPTLARPGDTVQLEVLRGPNFRATLPKKVHLRKAGRSIAKADLDPKTRTASLVIPNDVHGFLEITELGARTVLYVQPNDALSVTLSTDDDVYRPGDTAKLTVQTKAGENGIPATVSLAGVDQTLSQLAPLLATDDWGRITVRAQGEEAFGSFGPRALQLGQIRGENAAKATVLLVSQLPTDSTDDRGVSNSASTAPNEIEVLTSNFYRGLEALVGKVRAWERAAPKGEQIEPAKVHGWWKEVLKEADPPIVDAYGLPLSLHRLPSDLLDQTAPHQLVADSTRLSEDLENWTEWVEEHGR